MSAKLGTPIETGPESSLLARRRGNPRPNHPARGRELCQLAPLQARDLLARPVAEGKLTRDGVRRAALYRLVSNHMNLSK